MVNRYRRSYYLSSCRRIRLTLDSSMTYRSFRSAHPNPVHSDGSKIVVEVKFDSEHAEDADGTLSAFPFSFTKNSKYTDGVEHVFYQSRTPEGAGVRGRT
ncbi:VTC domain-containing protein [Lentibacter algarum]|uniref:VTC domain-containing protein n=1 Tax=Lentibacter algarum TaxID=576131 RepID=UPI003AF973B7